jgi:hypothetical protein
MKTDKQIIKFVYKYLEFLKLITNFSVLSTNLELNDELQLLRLVLATIKWFFLKIKIKSMFIVWILIENDTFEKKVANYDKINNFQI